MLNGLDFLVSALAHLQGDPSPRDMKYGVLHLSAGAALVLKERLRRQEPRLIFENEADFSEAAFRSGDFRSVKLPECIKRLKNIGVEVPAKARVSMAVLAKDRNRLEHFGARISVEALSATTASLLSFMLDFVAEQLEDEIGDDEAALLETIRADLPKFGLLVQQRLQEKEAKLSGPGTLRTCPTCTLTTLILGDAQVECAFCNRTWEPEIAADEYISAVLRFGLYRPQRGDVWPRFQCPDCDNEALVMEEDGYVCFQCGEEYGFGDLTECISCGNLFSTESEMAVCQECYLNALNKDD